jgi:ribosomal protein S18 acetylase RimI-like enzyme
MKADFRAGVAADAATIDRIFRKSFCDAFGHLYRDEDLQTFLAKFTHEAWLRELASPEYAFRLAEADGETLGYVKIGPLDLPTQPRGAALEIKQFYVLAAWQGRGVAQQLMEWALAEARARGAEELYLSVYTGNPRARRFYERYGFDGVGPNAFMVGEQADEDIIMRLTL